MINGALLFLQAITGLHPGSGTALGLVDLPVQRERHTGWATIPGSSLKGILREVCRRSTGKKGTGADSDQDLSIVFGPPTSAASEHAGALAVSDARLLAFPVRSLRGVFAWVSCPAVLERLTRDLSLLSWLPPHPSIPRVLDEHAVCRKDSPLLLPGGTMVLEEFEFKHDASTDPEKWLAWMAEVAPNEDGSRLGDHLVILSDNDFTYFVRYATEVVARVSLEYETKTVAKGALFYEEFLPPETIFYSLVLAENSRCRNKQDFKATQVMAYLRERLPAVMQVGAGETIGKGLCATRLWSGKEV